MRIASVTAGSAGMFCGSCMKDNALAAALTAAGHDCLLLPTFTPLTLDEPDHSAGRIFLGGVNVYLDEYRAVGWLPRWSRRWLDHPRILSWLSRFSGIEDYEKLGELTLSMLRGAHGRQRREFDDLISFLRDFHPDVVLLTNVLLSAVAPLVRDRLGVPVVATLQGDDIFLDALAPGHRAEAVELVRENGRALRGYIATSRYYADHMADYLGLARESIEVVYPGINPRHHQPADTDRSVPTVGYFARIAPEKGLHQLVDAFLHLRGNVPCRLRISGWLGRQHQHYLAEQMARLHRAGHGDDVDHVKCPRLADKQEFFHSIDVLCVPTVYREPKALYVYEALAGRVPCVLPRHGAFTELLEATGGGILVDPNDAQALATGLAALVNDPARRRMLGQVGRDAVLEQFTDRHMADRTVAVLQQCTRGAT